MFDISEDREVQNPKLTNPKWKISVFGRDVFDLMMNFGRMNQGAAENLSIQLIQPVFNTCTPGEEARIATGGTKK